MIMEAPAAYLDEYLRELDHRFQLKVGKARLSKILAKMDINRKKVYLMLFC
jgi:hypothetical protein